MFPIANFIPALYFSEKLSGKTFLGKLVGLPCLRSMHTPLQILSAEISAVDVQVKLETACRMRIFNLPSERHCIRGEFPAFCVFSPYSAVCEQIIACILSSAFRNLHLRINGPLGGQLSRKKYKGKGHISGRKRTKEEMRPGGIFFTRITETLE